MQDLFNALSLSLSLSLFHLSQPPSKCLVMQAAEFSIYSAKEIGLSKQDRKTFCIIKV